MDAKQTMTNMKPGDVVTLIVRDTTGRAVSCDFCTIVELYAAVAKVQQDNKIFTVIRQNLR